MSLRNIAIIISVIPKIANDFPKLISLSGNDIFSIDNIIPQGQ